MCPQNEASYSADVLDACLKSNPVELGQGGFKWYLPSTGGSNGQGYWYDIDIVLPDMECSRCVLRWRYHAENTWGCDAPNDCGIGKGYQEEFVNCADIQLFKGSSTPTVRVRNFWIVFARLES